MPPPGQKHYERVEFYLLLAKPGIQAIPKQYHGTGIAAGDDDRCKLLWQLKFRDRLNVLVAAVYVMLQLVSR